MTDVDESRPQDDASAPWSATPGQVVPGVWDCWLMPGQRDDNSKQHSTMISVLPAALDFSCVLLPWLLRMMKCNPYYSLSLLWSCLSWPLFITATETALSKECGKVFHSPLCHSYHQSFPPWDNVTWLWGLFNLNSALGQPHWKRLHC